MMNAVEVHCAVRGAQLWVDKETWERRKADVDHWQPGEEPAYHCKRCLRELIVPVPEDWK
jgi:hypothetical protein